MHEASVCTHKNRASVPSKANSGFLVAWRTRSAVEMVSKGFENAAW